MSVLTAYSTHTSVPAAVDELKSKLGANQPVMVLYFASSIYPPQELAAALQSAFPSAGTFGCTTAGELISGKMFQHSIVAMAFDEATAGKVKIEVIENMSGESNLRDVASRLESYFGVPLAEMDFQKYVGIILTDGLSLSEEKIMDQIGDLTNITVIGGSAGDDLQFKQTHVFANGKAHSNAAVLTVMQPNTSFDIIKTQSFNVLPCNLVATKVKEEVREVLEFNNQPAAKVYAEALGTNVGEASNHFMSNPVGLIAEGQPFVRSPQQIKGDSVVFYCNVLEGMELSLLESTDIIADTRIALAEKVAEMGGVTAIINFHCILRTLELRQKNLEGPYGALFTDIPTIGFSTYGEQYIGHINQTSTMLVFK